MIASHRLADVYKTCREPIHIMQLFVYVVAEEDMFLRLCICFNNHELPMIGHKLLTT